MGYHDPSGGCLQWHRTVDFRIARCCSQCLGSSTSTCMSDVIPGVCFKWMNHLYLGQCEPGFYPRDMDRLDRYIANHVTAAVVS